MASVDAAKIWLVRQSVREFIGSFPQAKLLRDGYAPPPPYGPAADQDQSLASALKREFLWRHPKWVPYTEAEERLPVGCLFALRAAGWHVGEHCWAAAIAIHNSMGNVKKAEQTFRAMQRDADITPTSTSFSKLLWAYALKGDRDKFKYTYQAAAGRGIALGPDVWAALMTLFQQLGLEDRVWDTFRYVVWKRKELRSGRVFAPLFFMAKAPPDVRRVLMLMRAFSRGVWIMKYHFSYALTAVVGHTAKGGSAAAALGIRDAATAVADLFIAELGPRELSERIVQDLRQWVLAFQHVAGDSSFFDELLAAYSDVLSKNLPYVPPAELSHPHRRVTHPSAPPPGQCTLHGNAWINVLRFCVNIGATRNAEVAFSLLNEPKPSSYALLLSAYVADGSFAKVRALWTRMQDRGVHPNRTACSLFLQACGDRCSSSSDMFVLLAERVFQDAVDRGLHKGDVHMWAMLMRVYSKAGDARKARALERTRKYLNEPKGKLFAGYFRDVSPGPTPAASQVWEPLGLDEAQPPEATEGEEALEQEQEADPEAEPVHTVVLPLSPWQQKFESEGALAVPYHSEADSMAERRTRVRKLAWTPPCASRSSPFT
ncbi:hypothetical protein DIPPA_00829 [Diplonema papillatum]|nr:hypothetical protein DIPPA_00829 [Diplonema papillatum]